MKIGLTGLNGFLGNSVSDYLIKNDHTVISLDHITCSDMQINNFNNINIMSLDWVLHFGSKTSISESQTNPFITYSSNINSTLYALNIAEKANAYIIFMSSFVYGKPVYTPIDENHPVSATNPYMSSKIISEDICINICRLKNIPLIILRGFNIYGKKLIPGRLISDLLISRLSNRTISINDPNPLRDYLYEKDFNDLILSIVESKQDITGIFNVGYGESYSNLDVANIISNLGDDKLDINISNNKRNNDVLDCTADVSLVMKTFSWKPKYSLINGINDLYKYLINKDNKVNSQ